MNKIIIAILFFFAFTTVSFSMKYSQEEVKDTLNVGDMCPDYAFQDTAGVKQSLKSLRGKYVFIDVWASWCGPCRQQFPYLKELEENFKSEDIAFVSVNIDYQDFRWLGDVQNLHLSGLQWKVLDSRAFKDQFNMKYIPRCIMLDKEGKVLRYKMSLPSKPETKEYLTHLLGL
ncbi:TlpA family protein disulfide reductase [Plebeiibacterium sediminum]|uniref:TlpA family protein disulfide reductase n=1 Tax=Plebeiibacterium sediminum TaxID=2992112 RepID=A0AAE3SFT0_9BACT|nr:TlpA disulfide reductase family protein [Plebeiobacterium sediminum]MCW3787768.1 TlpA family protein disulfide reductase [Plebeiobacterium sediminum]